MTLIMGLPNAGKTTYSQRFENVLHVDDYPPSKFAHCNEAVKDRGGDVVVEGIYNTKAQRKALLDVATGEKVCIWLDTPAEVCISRENRLRSDLIIWQAQRLFEPPDLAEGWDEIRIIRNDKEEVIRRNFNGDIIRSERGTRD